MEKHNEKHEMENNEMENRALTALETKLSFIESMVEAQTMTVEPVDEQEKELKEAMQKVMSAKGLVSCPVPPLFFVKDSGWRETIRQRLVALIECHRPGGNYNIKIHDLEIMEYKTVRNGNTKTQVAVSKETAIAKYIAMLMSDSKDKSEKLIDGSYKITPAKSPASFIIKAPTTKKPTLSISFDMDK